MTDDARVTVDLTVEIVELLTVKEVAGEYRVSERTVRRWIRDRKLDALRVGDRGQWRVKVPRL